MKKFLLIYLLLFTFSGKGVFAQEQYCTELNGNFGEAITFSQVSSNTQSYKTTKDYSGREIKLHTDIYQGIGQWSNAQKRIRPLIILFHGGGFKSGARNTTIMQIIARYYAQRGYLVASADYRKGWNGSDGTALCGSGDRNDYLDAQYRAMQDERSLVQYFKSQSSTLGFDTNRIFLLGISSGATLVCSRLEDQWISEDHQRRERLGALEVFEGNRNFNTDVAGIISIAGANLSPEVDEQYHIPIQFFHGTCDNAVPFEEQYLASCSNMGYYYGPKILSQALAQKGVCHQNIIYCGFGHDFAAVNDRDNALPWAFEDILKRSLAFMQNIMCGQCTSTELIANIGVDVKSSANCSPIHSYEICQEVSQIFENTIALMPNLFYDDYTLYIHSNWNQSKDVVLNIYNMSGSRVQSHNLKLEPGAKVQQIQLSEMDKGVYLYQVIDGKKVFTSGKFWKP